MCVFALCVSWHEEPNRILALSGRSFAQNPVICCTEGEVLEAPVLKLGHLLKDCKRFIKLYVEAEFNTTSHE